MGGKTKDRNYYNYKTFSSPLLNEIKEKRTLSTIKKELDSREKELQRKYALQAQRASDLEMKELSIENLLHEVRKINSNLQDSIDAIDFDKVPQVVQEIWAQANLLSIRLRCYDYEVNPDIITNTSKFNFPVYKKIDKIRKTLKDSCKDKNITIKLKKNTFLAYRGHDILEVAFFIILENAIKYAVPYSEIEVYFHTEGTQLTVEFVNRCEQLPSQEEIPKLTGYGFRGINASEKGDGIGLYTLNTILKLEEVKMNILTSTQYGLNKFIVRLVFSDCIDRTSSINWTI